MLKRPLSAFSFLLSLSAFSQTPVTERLEEITSDLGAFSILAEDIKSYLKVLTSDELAGRETGKNGQKLAGKYLAGKMKEFGMSPGNDTSFFQVFTVNELKPEGEIKLDGVTNNFLKEFYFVPGMGDTLISSNEIVFCGYGIDDPKYSDYAKVNVKGKIILILEGEPIDKDSISLISSTKKPSEWAHDIRKKSKLARDKGALAVLYYSKGYTSFKSRFHHFLEKPTMKLKGEVSEREKSKMSVFYMGDTLLNQILAKNSSAKKELTRLLNSGGRPKKYPIIKTEIEISVKRSSTDLTTENVIGFIEGTDKKEEAIIITAHYDHLGIQGKEIYYGADDDGSGTAAILEIGEAFMQMVKAGMRPRRSIIIMPVSGEEKGLLGSLFYSKNPTVPLVNIVADLNIDMIGRRDEKYKDDPDYVYVIGSEMLSEDLKKVSEKTNDAHTQIKLDYTYDDPADPNRFYYRSDHYNFAKNNIPVIFYFCGVHEDYHKPSDTFDKIEFGKMEKITRLVFYTAWELANREERLKLKE